MKKALQECGEPMHALSKWTIRDAENNVEKTASELTGHRVERDAFRMAFARDWNAQAVDFVLAQVFVGPACAHDTAFYWNYMYLWNFVDYPGVVFPTPIKAELGEQCAPANETPLSDDCRHVRRLWEETEFTGAPIGLQLVARRYRENDLFGALRVMQRILELP